MEQDIESILNNAQLCPNPMCNNSGCYPEGPTDSPEPVQCEFCYTVPDSLFNAKQKVLSLLSQKDVEIARIKQILRYHKDGCVPESPSWSILDIAIQDIEKGAVR